MTIEFGAAITDDQMYQGERVALKWGVTRRIALGVLTRSSSDFKDMDAGAAEAMMDAYDCVTEYLRWREGQTEYLESAQARLLVVLESYSDTHPNHEVE